MSKLVQNYLLQQPIGKGVYGQVYKAIHQKTKQLFAVKVIPKSSFKSNPKLEQLAINQISILSSLKHQNIVKFIETLKTPNNFYFVYEYCNEGTLEHLLKKKKFLKQNQALIVFRQILEAFKQLNKNNIMHRDLKPDNIFVNNGKIKLGDFGFCKMLEVNMAQTMLGSPIYMAPEILREQIYTSKADIWSLGVLLFQLLFGYCPFQSNSISKLINVLKQNQLFIPKQINPISQKTQTLLRKMLVKDQFKRIQWVDLFDFKIDQTGNIISAFNKQMRIEQLQKYFLGDIKSVGQIIIGSVSQNNKTNTQTNCEEIKSIEIKSQQYQNQSKKQNNQNTHATSLKKVLSTQNHLNKSEKYTKHTLSSQKKLQNNNKQIQEFSYKTYQNSNSNQPQKLENSQKRSSKQNSQKQINKTQNMSQSQGQNHCLTHSSSSFLQKHSCWLQAIQLISQLGQNNHPDNKQNQKWIYWIAKTLSDRLLIQSISYPEWTDVIMQQKQQISILIREIQNEYVNNKTNVNGYDKKNQLYKLWCKSTKKGEIGNLQDKAIRFIFQEDNIMDINNKTVDQILLC